MKEKKVKSYIVRYQKLIMLCFFFLFIGGASIIANTKETQAKTTYAVFIQNDKKQLRCVQKGGESGLKLNNGGQAAGKQNIAKQSTNTNITHIYVYGELPTSGFHCYGNKVIHSIKCDESTDIENMLTKTSETGLYNIRNTGNFLGPGSEIQVKCDPEAGGGATISVGAPDHTEGNNLHLTDGIKITGMAGTYYNLYSLITVHYGTLYGDWCWISSNRYNGGYGENLFTYEEYANGSITVKNPYKGCNESISKTTNPGGGIQLNDWSGNSSKVVLYNCYINNCHSVFSGGAIHATTSDDGGASIVEFAAGGEFSSYPSEDVSYKSTGYATATQQSQGNWGVQIIGNYSLNGAGNIGIIKGAQFNMYSGHIRNGRVETVQPTYNPTPSMHSFTNECKENHSADECKGYATCGNIFITGENESGPSKMNISASYQIEITGGKGYYGGNIFIDKGNIVFIDGSKGSSHGGCLIKDGEGKAAGNILVRGTLTTKDSCTDGSLSKYVKIQNGKSTTGWNSNAVCNSKSSWRAGNICISENGAYNMQQGSIVSGGVGKTSEIYVMKNGLLNQTSGNIGYEEEAKNYGDEVTSYVSISGGRFIKSGGRVGNINPTNVKSAIVVNTNANGEKNPSIVSLTGGVVLNCDNHYAITNEGDKDTQYESKVVIENLITEFDSSTQNTKGSTGFVYKGILKNGYPDQTTTNEGSPYTHMIVNGKSDMPVLKNGSYDKIDNYGRMSLFNGIHTYHAINNYGFLTLQNITIENTEINSWGYRDNTGMFFSFDSKAINTSGVVSSSQNTYYNGIILQRPSTNCYSHISIDKNKTNSSRASLNVKDGCMHLNANTLCQVPITFETANTAKTGYIRGTVSGIITQKDGWIRQDDDNSNVMGGSSTKNSAGLVIKGGKYQLEKGTLTSYINNFGTMVHFDGVRDGKLYNNADATSMQSNGTASTLDNHGNATQSGGTINGNIVNHDDGTVIQNGGTFSGTTFTNEGKAEQNGGYFQGNLKNYGTYSHKGGTKSNTGTTFQITNKNVYNDKKYEGKVNISGGIIYMNISNFADINIEGNALIENKLIKNGENGSIYHGGLSEQTPSHTKTKQYTNLGYVECNNYSIIDDNTSEPLNDILGFENNGIVTVSGGKITGTSLANNNEINLEQGYIANASFTNKLFGVVIMNAGNVSSDVIVNYGTWNSYDGEIQHPTTITNHEIWNMYNGNISAKTMNNNKTFNFINGSIRLNKLVNMSKGSYILGGAFYNEEQPLDLTCGIDNNGTIIQDNGIIHTNPNFDFFTNQKNLELYGGRVENNVVSRNGTVLVDGGHILAESGIGLTTSNTKVTMKDGCIEGEDLALNITTDDPAISGNTEVNLVNGVLQSIGEYEIQLDNIKETSDSVKSPILTISNDVRNGYDKYSGPYMEEIIQKRNELPSIYLKRYSTFAFSGDKKLLNTMNIGCDNKVKGRPLMQNQTDALAKEQVENKRIKVKDLPKELGVVANEKWNVIGDAKDNLDFILPNKDQYIEVIGTTNPTDTYEMLEFSVLYDGTEDAKIKITRENMDLKETGASENEYKTEKIVTLTSSNCVIGTKTKNNITYQSCTPKDCADMDILKLHNNNDEQSFGNIKYHVEALMPNVSTEKDKFFDYAVQAGRVKVSVKDRFKDSQELGDNENSSWSFMRNEAAEGNEYTTQIGTTAREDGKNVSVELQGFGYSKGWEDGEDNGFGSQPQSYFKVEGVEHSIDDTNNTEIYKTYKKTNNKKETTKLVFIMPANKNVTGGLKITVVKKDHKEAQNRKKDNSLEWKDWTGVFTFTGNTNETTLMDSMRRRIIKQGSIDENGKFHSGLGD